LRVFLRGDAYAKRLKSLAETITLRSSCKKLQPAGFVSPAVSPRGDPYRKGNDPQSEKVAARRARNATQPLASDIVEAVAVRFLAEHVRPKLRPRTVVEVDRHVGKIVKAFAGRRLSEIKRAEVREFIAAIKIAGTPISASHCLNWFKGLCSWAISEELIEASPAAGIRSPAAETPRDRII
jgi:hypothetical protein